MVSVKGFRLYISGFPLSAMILKLNLIAVKLVVQEEALVD
jgi:hypothetical protein